MTPRRLLPFLAIFLVLAGSYFLLEWRQSKKAQEKAAAQKVFPIKEADITAITLQRGAEEIRLLKEGQHWRLTHPLQEKADQVIMQSLLAALAYLNKDRDLGPSEDLKPFELDQPPLVVTFTAGEKTHTLAVGKKTPGERGFYARRDQDPQVLVIAATSKGSLDRPLSALRDRTLFDFAVDKVKALKIKTGSAQVDLEKTGSAWRWVGRDAFKIYPDRLERLLRYLSLARVKEFVADAPGSPGAYGLSPPALEITVVTTKGEQRLALGARTKDNCYARQGDNTPVVFIESLLLDLLTAPLESVAGLKKNPQWANLKGTFPHYLEDRRLWTGEVSAVSSLTWGTPDQTWSAAKDKDFFKLTGPDKKGLRQPAVRVELALLKLRDLEGERRPQPGLADAKALYAVELKDAEKKTLFHLEKLGVSAGQVEVRISAGAAPAQSALVPKAAYDEWQEEMERLTSPMPSPEKP